MMYTASDVDLQRWALSWLVVATFVLFRHARAGRGVGLLLSYVLSLGALHWFAPTLYLLPWAAHADLALTVEGLRQSVFAIGGLAIGAELATLVHRRRHAIDDSEPDATVPTSLVHLYLISGALMYVALFSWIGRLPTLRAVIVTGSSLAVVGVALKCWNAWHTNRTQAWLWLAASALFPVMTVLTQGYLGYGFVAMVMIFGFFASFSRPRWRVLALGAVLLYGGLSVYVTYMRDRQEIRETVWYGGTTSDRVQKLQDTLYLFEWFDLNDIDHIRRVDVRLNQDYLVGAAVVHIGDGNVAFAQGSTLLEALLALIPRALWPDKPMVAGSGDLVSIYTGFRFPEGTSVGVGQVMEFYINFGVPGVIAGFALIGFLLVLADRSACAHLKRGDSSRFLLWYLPALSLLQVGGSLTEVTATAGSSYVIALVFCQIARQIPRTTDSPIDSPARAEAIP